MPSVTNQVIDEFTAKIGIEGAQKAIAEAKALDVSIDGVKKSLDETKTATVGAEAAWNRLINKYDEVARAQAEVARVQGVVDRSRAQGLGTEEQHAKAIAGSVAALDAARARASGAVPAFNNLGKATNESGKNFAAMGRQAQQLGYQVNDVFTSLASGSSVFQVFAQQSGQVYQALSDGPGGVTGSLKRLGSAFADVLTPGRLVFGGLAAGALAAGAALNSYLDRQKELERVLTSGRGRLGGVRPADVEGAAGAVSGRTTATTGEAREAATELAATGAVSSRILAQATEVAIRFAKTTGQDVPAATAELARALADPARGASLLEERLGFLSESQQQLIVKTAAAGDRLRAQQMILEAMAQSGALAEASQKIRTLGDVWDAVAKSASNSADALVGAIGRAVSPDTFERLERLETLRRASSRPEQFDKQITEERIRAVTEIINAENRLTQEAEKRAAAQATAAAKINAATNLEIEGMRATTNEEKARTAGLQALLAVEGQQMSALERLAVYDAGYRKSLEGTNAALANSVKEQERQIKYRQAEINTIGQSADVRDPYLAKLRAENEMISHGHKLKDEEAQKYITNAEKLAELGVEHDKTAEAARRNAEAMTAAGNAAQASSAQFAYAGDAMAAFAAEAAANSLAQSNQAVFGKTEGLKFQLLPGQQIRGMAGLQQQRVSTIAKSGTLPEGWVPGTPLKPPGTVAPTAVAPVAAAAPRAIDLSGILSPIASQIDRLRGMQETALGRTYRPDPYRERNPNFFYSGERIFKEGADKQFDALQRQITKLEGLQASLSTLVSQNASMPAQLSQSMVAALNAAGFGNLGAQIVAAIASATPAPAPATPAPTAVQAGPLPNTSIAGGTNTGTNRVYSSVGGM